MVDRRSAASRRRLLAALLLALAGCSSNSHAQDEALRRSLGVEIERYVEADRTAPPGNCQVLFVGSSSIVHWKPTLAQDMAPLPVINRGFGGSYIEHVNLWFGQIVAPYQPRAIVLYAGENDLNAGEPVAEVLANFDTFMGKKTAALGNTPVYFISLKPSKARFTQLAQQSAVNAGVRARAARRADLHYIDVAPLMLENGQPKNIYRADGLHLTAAGYRLWTQAVRAAILPNSNAELAGCERREGQR
ncbi:MAG: hypothetical protein JSR67_14160 [Proteobacteria bacterium]|nr:hypothetical protein [Pseudomonadota bacterium]